MGVKLKVSEKDLQRGILQLLKAKGIFCWRNNTGGFMRDEHFYRFGDNGSPDVFAVVHGQIYGIEAKSTGGKQSEYQKDWQQRFEKAGGIYILAYDLDDIKI